MREGFTFNKLFMDFPGKREVKYNVVNYINNNFEYSSPIIRAGKELDRISFRRKEIRKENPFFTEVSLKNLKLDSVNNEKKENKFKSYKLIKQNRKNVSKSLSSNRPYIYNEAELPFIKVKDLDCNRLLEENSLDKNNKFFRKMNINDVIYFEKKFVKKPFKF